MAACYAAYELVASTAAVAPVAAPTTTVSRVPSSVPVPVPVPVPPTAKDYSRPLHVDCSVEYELPNQAKPPAGVRNEPLLMIHPCYFRKIESQRRSPFVNNLPTRQQQAPPPPQAAAPSAAAKRRLAGRGQQLPQQVPQQAAQYPVQYADTISRQHQQQHQQLWEPMPSSQASAYCASAQGGGKLAAAYPTSGTTDALLGHCWSSTERSPNRPADDAAAKHILTGKYRQYLRAHRLHPYVTSAMPLGSTFPPIHQQVCYNV